MESARAFKRLVRTVEDQEWLQPLTESIDKNVVSRAYEGLGTAKTPILNTMHGSILGHPLHPVLSDVPIGAWTTAFALDLADVSLDRRDLGPGADAAIALGLIGSTLTAMTGWADWKYTSGRTKRTGLVHGMLNIGAASLYLVSYLLRRAGARGLGQIVSFMGFGVVLAGAYLGGELVFDRLIGTKHTDDATKPEDFTAVAAVEELEEGKPHRVEVDEIPIVLIRSNGDIYGLSDACAHLGVSLSHGKVHDGCITCAAHGSTFKLENGTVVTGPSAYPQPVFDVRVRDGQVEVRRPS